MRQLMRYHSTNALLLRIRRLHRINEQIDLAVRNQSPILHGTRGKLGNGAHIQLGQRVRNAEEVIELVQGAGVLVRHGRVPR